MERIRQHPRVLDILAYIALGLLVFSLIGQLVSDPSLLVNFNPSLSHSHTFMLALAIGSCLNALVAHAKGVGRPIFDLMAALTTIVSVASFLS